METVSTTESLNSFNFNVSGKSVNAGEKTSVSKAKQTSSSQVKPFAGKVFYLDLQSNRTAETLESDIKQLGGVIKASHSYFYFFFYIEQIW